MFQFEDWVVYHPGQPDEEVLVVVFEGQPERSDYGGIEEYGDKVTVWSDWREEVDEITWDKEKFTEEQNTVIDNYLASNWAFVEDQIIKKWKEE